MNLWLRVRRTQACAVTILLVAIALVPSDDQYLPVPNVLGGPALVVPLALLIPLAVAVVVGFGLTTGNPPLEAVASRPLRLLDAAYALSTAMLAAAACALIQTMARTDLALAAGRNSLGYVGLTLVGRRLLGSHAAPLLPAGSAIACSLFGIGGGGQPHWWAWPLAASGNIASWTIAMGILLLGIAALMRTDETAAEQ